MPDESNDSVLYREGRDLTAAAAGGTLFVPAFRQGAVGQVVAELDRRQSVLITGPSGVGKTAVVHGVAVAMAQRGAGVLVELTVAAIIAAGRHLGDWQAALAHIVHRAAADGAVLYFADAWNLPRAGRSGAGDPSLLDALRPYLHSGEVVLLAEVTDAQLRQVRRMPSFAGLFHVIELEPLSSEQVAATLARRGQRMGVVLDEAARDCLVQLTNRFLPGRPQPGPALELLELVVDRMAEARPGNAVPALTPPVIEQVFAARTGLPLFVVSRNATRKATEIRQWFAERIVGQNAAIEAVLETIALFKAGLHDPGRPIGTMLFVGPAGVGKTELARALATFLFGSADRLLRVELGAHADHTAFEPLLEGADDPLPSGALADPIRSRPFKVVLLDGLEKVRPDTWELLRALLDEGRLAASGGEVIDFRTTIVIATSTVGAVEAARGPGFGAGDDLDIRALRTREALEDHFHSDVLDRFQHVVVFHPLSRDQVRTVARQELQRVLDREGIIDRRVLVDVQDSAIDLVVERGYDAHTGARSLKRILHRQLVLPIAMSMLERRVEPGQVLEVSARDNHVRVRTTAPTDARGLREASEPVRLPDGRKGSLQDITDAVARCRTDVESLARAVDEPGLQAQRNHLLTRRKDPEFWKNQAEAARSLRDLDRVTVVLDRVARLRVRVAGLEDELRGADSHKRLQRLVDALDQLEQSLLVTWRELVHMGADGHWDVLVEVTPVAPDGTAARDLLVRTYADWARSRRMEWLWLLEPTGPDEPALFAIRGRYAHGLLKLESGLHRVRPADADEHRPPGVARVRTAPWTDKSAQVVPTFQQSIQGTGAYGGDVHSRLECGDGLVLQNGRSLEENLETAAEIAGPWADAPPPSDENVRRIDLVTPMLRDHLTGVSNGRPDALSPDAFHELLCRRIDHLAAQWLGSDMLDEPTEA